MDRDRRSCLARIAGTLARSGEYGNWRAVQVRLLQLGHEDAEDFFLDQILRTDIDAICAHAIRKQPT